MTKDANQLSFSSFVSFLGENFSLIIIVLLFFAGGFFFGSVWTEKNMYKELSTGGSQPPVVAATAPTAQGARDLSIPQLVAKASTLNIDAEQLQSCIDSGEMATLIANQMSEASNAGIGGTPATIVMVNGIPAEQITGALPYAQIKKIIDTYLNGTEKKADPALTSIPKVSEADHLRGSANATIVLVEYSDFECPFCQSFHPTMTQIMAEYGDRVAWVYRHYPLAFHPQAQKAAEASECVAKLSNDETFWQYADSLFAG